MPVQSSQEWDCTVWWFCQHSLSDGATVGMAIGSIYGGVITVNDFGVYVWSKGEKNIKRTEDCK